MLRLSRLLMMRLALPVSPQSVAPCLALARRLCGRAPRCGEVIRGLFALVAALRHAAGAMAAAWRATAAWRARVLAEYRRALRLTAALPAAERPKGW